MVEVEDAREIVRAYPRAAGEYRLSVLERLTVNTLHRSLAMTTFRLLE